LFRVCLKPSEKKINIVTMPSLYTTSLFIVSAAHILFSLGNLLKIPPYNPAAFIVDGKPGTGNTGIEKLLEAVFAGWYLSSIVGVLLAYNFSNRSSVKFTLICPMIYHIMATYLGVFLVGDWGVCNITLPLNCSPRGMAIFHSFMTLLFGYLFIKT